jgi:hypothetical protein
MKGPAESGQICSVGRRKIAKKIAKNKRCCANTLRPRSRMLLKVMKTRAGGLVLTRHEGGGKWGTATYSAAQNTGGLGIEPDASYGLYAP